VSLRPNRAHQGPGGALPPFGFVPVYERCDVWGGYELIPFGPHHSLRMRGPERNEGFPLSNHLPVDEFHFPIVSVGIIHTEIRAKEVGIDSYEGRLEYKMLVMLHEIGHNRGVHSEYKLGKLMQEFYEMMAKKYKGTDKERIYKALAKGEEKYAESHKKSGFLKYLQLYRSLRNGKELSERDLRMLIEAYESEGRERGYEGRKLRDYVNRKLKEEADKEDEKGSDKKDKDKKDRKAEDKDKKEDEPEEDSKEQDESEDPNE